MAVIVLRCPKTGRNIEPAIDIAAVDFRAIPAAGEGISCPLCGEQHGWLPYAARLAEAMHRTERVRLPKD